MTQASINDENLENNSYADETPPLEPNANDSSEIITQDGGQTCSCGGKSKMLEVGSYSNKSFIYALGRIIPRFPSPGIEKEYRQTVGKNETNGETDYETMRTVLSQRQNRHLVRQICWVLKIEGLDTYILSPNDPADYDLLVEVLRTPPRGTDVDLVIGIKGPIAGPEVCNGLMVPIVRFDQIFSFDVDTLIKSIPKPREAASKKFGETAEELFNRIIQLADNVGAIDEHRAINYLAVRYDDIYKKTAEMHQRNYSLSSIEVRTSRLSSTRKVVDPIFVYTDRTSGVEEKYFIRVDVTEEYPFLVTKLSPYYER